MSSALEKSIQVLETVARDGHGQGLSDLAREVGLSRQAVHRILGQLESAGLLQRAPRGSKPIIGQRLKQLSLACLTAAQATAASHEILEGLVGRLGETCNVGMLDGLEVVYLDRVECDWPLRLQLQPGSRVPAHCSAIGKILLAYLPESRRARLLRANPLRRYTAYTVTDSDRLEEDFAKIRQDKLCLNNQEYALGLLGLGVPVFSAGDAVVAALAVHAPTARMDELAARSYLPALRQAAEDLAGAFKPG